MRTSQSVDNLFLISVIADETYAIPVNAVREIVTMPRVSTMPGLRTHVRGVINLRNSIIPVMDMRLRLGKMSCADETEIYVKMMSERESDHRNWLHELEQSVIEKRPFKLATDPHQCAFGKWYDSYDAQASTNLCLSINMIMPKFEDPHERIHAIANKVKKMEEAGAFEKAMALIEKTRNSELAKMIDLFEEARMAIKERKRELAVIVETRGKKIAIAVDAVESVEHLDQESDEKICLNMVEIETPIVERISKRTKDQALVIVLNLENLNN